MSAKKKLAKNVNLDSALAFTKSSFSYKDPYQTNGNILYKLRNRMQSFYALRMTENEFVDFKPYKMKYFDIPLIVSQSQEGFEFM